MLTEVELEWWLYYLTEAFADETRRELLYAQLGMASGMNRDKIVVVLDALYQFLTEELPLN